MDNAPLSFLDPRVEAALAQLSPALRATRDALIGICAAAGVPRLDLDADTGHPLDDFTRVLFTLAALSLAIAERVVVEQAAALTDVKH